jgi:iron complex outermembrane receptor protein
MKPFYTRSSFFLLGFSLCIAVHAQQPADTLAPTTLGEVTIRAFEQNRKLKDVPAAINFIGRNAIERFGPASLVQAVNSTPGVRMEERSPGSYRFNIRGSSLRSPFGVRNVKVYLNDLPFTDPGGQTYLNQLGTYNFGSLEIIKGPGSSLYGAGTGGVLLIESLREQEQAGILTEEASGSNGLKSLYVAATTSANKLTARASFQHLESTGYRDHSYLNKDVHSWIGNFHFNERQELKASFLYGDLYYQTPGALTKAEYDANPAAARPSVGGTPGSAAAFASIHQRLFLTGVSYRQQLSKEWSNKSLLYGMFTELRNPSLRNYTRSAEPHVGGRSTFQWLKPIGKSTAHVDIGAEWQQGFGSVTTNKNVGGLPDTLQSYDEINNRLQFLFAQAYFDLPGWTLTAGASIDQLRIKFQRFAPASLGIQHRRFNNQVAPRVSVLRKMGKLNAYASVSKGFSPPSTAELLPTGGAVNLGLNAEEGRSYDVGIRGNLAKRLSIDVTGFLFNLKSTIVQRRDASGGDFYINSGKTRQYGVETYLSYTPFTSRFFEHDYFWLSHTWHHFRYTSFKQLTTDFSGKQLPGEAPHTVSAGFDWASQKGLFGTISYFFSDRIPLDDGNTAYAGAYHLVDARLGYQGSFGKRWRLRLTAGAGNLLNQRYSLGNDINGFGGRFYNAAPRRNYYISLLLEYKVKDRSM